jgi:hypothetical protein
MQVDCVGLYWDAKSVTAVCPLASWGSVLLFTELVFVSHKLGL